MMYGPFSYVLAHLYPGPSSERQDTREPFAANPGPCWCSSLDTGIESKNSRGHFALLTQSKCYSACLLALKMDWKLGELIRPRGYITFFMLNSAEHEIFSANKYENANIFFSTTNTYIYFKKINVCLEN